MQNQLIIRLSHHIPLSHDWVFVDKKNNATLTSRHKTFNEIIDKEKKYQIIVLIPAVDVYLTEITLPTMSKARLTKAMAFALEDELATSIYNIHYVVGRRNKKNLYPVAVIDRNKLQIWITYLRSIFKSENIFIDYLLPDVLTLPFTRQKWKVHTHQGLALVRTSLHSGFAIEVEEIWKILRLIIRKEKNTKPEIEWISNSPIATEILEYLATHNIACKKIDPEEAILTKMSKHILSAKELNLLAGQINPQFKRRLQWISQNLALAICIIVSFGLLLQLIILEAQNYQLKNKLTAHVNTILPNTAATEPKLKTRIEQRLDVLKNQQYPKFFRLLHALSPELVSAKLIHLKYDNIHLDITIQFKDQSFLNTLKNKLSKKNMSMKILSSKIQTNQTEATIRIHETID